LGCAPPGLGELHPLAGQQFGGDAGEVAGEQGAAEQALRAQLHRGVQGDVAGVVEGVGDGRRAVAEAGHEGLVVDDVDVLDGDRGDGRAADAEVDTGADGPPHTERE